jgi:hypothetical protein
MGCGVLDAGAALELATSYDSTTGATAACSTAGDARAAWPAKLSQTITFAPLAGKKLGDPDFTVHATASSGLPVAFAVRGNCTINGPLVHLVRTGSCTVTATQAGDTNYDVAPALSRCFRIAKRPRPSPARKVRPYMPIEW